jgi:hypothetical protein
MSCAVTQVEKLRDIPVRPAGAQRTYNQARSDYQMSLWQPEQAIGRPPLTSGTTYFHPRQRGSDERENRNYERAHGH